MKNYFDSFQAEIDRVADLLRQEDALAEQARLVLLGRIGYAVERGDLSAREGYALDDQLGGLLDRYDDAVQLANGRRPEQVVG